MIIILRGEGDLNSLPQLKIVWCSNELACYKGILGVIV